MLAFAVVVSLLNVVRAYMAIWAAAAGGWIAVPCSNDALGEYFNAEAVFRC